MRSRIIRYCKYGNHKRELINDALRNGYEMWVRVKVDRSERDAQNKENELVDEHDYAWSKRRNGGVDGMRDIL